MLSSTIIHAYDHKTYRQDCREDWGAGLRHQSLQWHGFESYSCHFANIPKEKIVSIILDTCTWCHLPFSMLLTKNIQEGLPIVMGRWFMGTSHFGGVGSIPFPVILMTFLYKVLFPLFLTPTPCIFYHYPCYSPHNIQAGWLSGLRHQSLQLRGFVSHSCYFDAIPIQSIVSCILNTCTLYLLPSSMLLTQ